MMKPAALADADAIVIVSRGASKRKRMEAALAGADLPLPGFLAIPLMRLYRGVRRVA
jgi:6-phosphogluconolactonase/glucosamine-6-phosphate isomerase/deaminase